MQSFIEKVSQFISDPKLNGKEFDLNYSSDFNPENYVRDYSSITIDQVRDNFKKFQEKFEHNHQQNQHFMMNKGKNYTEICWCEQPNDYVKSEKQCFAIFENGKTLQNTNYYGSWNQEKSTLTITK